LFLHGGKRHHVIRFTLAFDVADDIIWTVTMNKPVNGSIAKYDSQRDRHMGLSIEKNEIG
jgi:hypothetical protein